MATREDLAKTIAEVSTLHGSFTLRSGQTSDTYFDKYIFESNPLLLADIASKMTYLIPPGTELLAGLEMGGIPIVTLMSHLNNIPARFVRKQRKGHGTNNLIEGGSVTGKKVCIVEDVVTSGGQILLSAADIRLAGGLVLGCIFVIDREQGGCEILRENDIEPYPLFTRSDLER